MLGFKTYFQYRGRPKGFSKTFSSSENMEANTSLMLSDAVGAINPDSTGPKENFGNDQCWKRRGKDSSWQANV